MKKGLLILLCIAGISLVPACYKKKDKVAKPKKMEKKVKIKKPKKVTKVKKGKKPKTKKLVYCEKCQRMHAPGLHS